MSDDLSGCFDRLIGGQSAPDEFGQELLGLCNAAPDRAWQALALLDRVYRQRYISDALCRALRQRIGALAMRLEGHAVATMPGPLEPPRGRAAPRVLPSVRVDHRPQATPVSVRRSPPAGAHVRLAQHGFRSAPALALVGAVLGVAASDPVQDPPETALASASEPTAAAAPAPPVISGPSIVSIASDRYIAQPNQRSLSVIVQRSGGADEDTHFRWWTESGDAHSGQDYAGSASQIVEMPRGTESVPLQVRILPNPQRRHIEMFYVAIGSTSEGAQIGANRRAAVFVFPDHMK